MFNKHKIEYLLFIFIGKLLSLFGFRNIKNSSKILAYISFKILKIRKKVVIKNLSLAFPNFSSEDISKLAYKSYISAAITFLEIFNFSKLSKTEIESLISPAGLEPYRKKILQSNGLILLTAHIGNWELGAVAIGIYLKQTVNVLIKNQKNVFVKDWLTFIREKYGNKEISIGTSVKEIFKVLREGKLVGIVGDQRGPREGMKIDFFGNQTSVFVGTASIALKTKCPVIMAFCVRQPNHKYELIFEELKYENNFQSKEESLQSFNQSYMTFLENTIRKYPDQWFWMHNIWKY